jgi:hypothetical protein
MNAQESPRGMSAAHPRARRLVVVDRMSIRLAAALLLTGQVLYIVVTQFHTDGKANDHSTVFAEYAASESWTAVHVAQFASAAILVGGLAALALAVRGRAGTATWPGRFGAGLAGVALAMYATLQALDGVGNKQVDAAWVSANAAEKAARFASAEGMRWLEWGLRSYLDFALGAALLLVAAAIMRTPRVGPIAYPLGLSGLIYLVQGWVVGSEGFTETHTILIVLAWAVSLSWMSWLAVVAWRMQQQSAGSWPDRVDEPG